MTSGRAVARTPRVLYKDTACLASLKLECEIVPAVDESQRAASAQFTSVCRKVQGAAHTMGAYSTVRCDRQSTRAEGLMGYGPSTNQVGTNRDSICRSFLLQCR